MRVIALAVAILLIATASPGEVRRIRLCADPSNLPFSAQDAREPGFEVEIGRAIADALGADLDVYWYPTARELMAFRQLAEGRCDLLMGLPLNAAFTDDKPRFLFSEPYYVMRQVLVSPGVGAVRSLDDLQGKVIGVQAMTLSDQLVYERGHKRKIYRKAEETFEALARGEVDAAVMESPLAGWFITRHAGFQGVVISDPARDIRIGAALRKSDPDLKRAVDRSIERLQVTKVPEILGRYGMTLVQAHVDSAALSPELRAAKSTYLTQCSQCHGTDAKGTPVAANLRAFKGTEADFVRLVQNGRPGTAMTPWKGLISEDDIRSILRYVKQLSTE
ncbi:MAG TPA: transporter substrate-binding domain-containing protein [Methylomirabilota bacterium]